jgi:hypothetical protein
MNYSNIISTIALLGIGAITPKLFEYFFDRQKNIDQTKHDFKQTRFKTIILLMYALLDFEKIGILFLKIIGTLKINLNF